MRILVFPGLVAAHLLEGSVCYERASHRIDIKSVSSEISKVRHALEQKVREMVEQKKAKGKQASIELHKTVLLNGLRLRRTESGDDLPSDSETVGVLRKRQLAISEVHEDPEMLFSMADHFHLLAGRTSINVKRLGSVLDSVDQTQFTLDRLVMAQKPGSMSVTCPARQSSRALIGQQTVPESEKVLNSTLELAHQVTRVGLSKDFHVIQSKVLVEMVKLEKSVISAVSKVLKEIENGEISGFIKQPPIDGTVASADALIKIRDEQAVRMQTLKTQIDAVILEIAKLGLDLDDEIAQPSLSSGGVIAITGQRRGFQLFALLRSTQP